jgi:hypothetical protein
VPRTLGRSDIGREDCRRRNELGDLADLDVRPRGASLADGVMHLGFIHDFANFAKAA